MASSSPTPTSKTVVCIGRGPSLRPDDIAYCQGKAVVIALNAAWELAPWADVLYAADFSWWHVHQPHFSGAKFAVKHQGSAQYGATILDVIGRCGACGWYVWRERSEVRP